MNISSVRATASLFLSLTLVLSVLLSCGNSPPPVRDMEYPAPDEEKLFSELADHITKIQDELKNIKHQDGILRGFHAKPHGCLRGHLVVLPVTRRYVAPKFQMEPEDPQMRVIPAETQFGIFKDEQKYDILARFSSGVGFRKPDTELDVRGLAIKVLGVEGERVKPLPSDPHPEQHTQDFVMTNNPTQLASTAQEFMKFGEVQHNSFLASLFLMKKWRSMKVGSRILFREVASLVNEQYWSDAPIRLGTRTIKYTARPCGNNPSAGVRNGKDKDYLTEDLGAFAATNPICFDFAVQFQLDAIKQPIEDALTEWEEDDTPFVTVAQIQFPPQELKQTQGCEGLRFTPWHALREHQPVGNMNRGRRLVYESSQRHRAAIFKEPDERTIE